MKKISALLAFTALIQTIIFCQALTGTALTERGLGAANVTIAFQDKSNQVVTNPDGSFRIIATKLPDTLMFSGEAFETYRLVVTEKTLADPKFEVVLLQKRNALAMSKALPTYNKPLIERDKTAVEEISVRGSRGDATSYYIDGVRVSGTLPPKEEEEEISTHDAFEPSIYPDVTPIVTAKVVAKTSKSSSSVAYSTGDDRHSKTESKPAAVTTNLNGKTFAVTDSIFKPAAISPKSKLLTAGEVNDFLKWDMWQDLSEDEFKSFSDYWEIAPKERYCVQLANESGEAIVGEPVVLLDPESGKAIWRAITDNTGKAELWANLFPGKTPEQLTIQGKGFKLKRPLSFHNGINRVTVATPCQTSNTVEIAFVMDATGSMNDELEFLKVELEDVIRSTFDDYDDLQLRAGSVFFRDLNDQYVTRHIDFNDDLLKVLNFIKLQTASGGGDNPEAVDSAIHVAINQLTWSENARTKLLFLIGDAEPHDYAKKDMKILIEQAAAKGIRIVPLACSGTNKRYEYLQRSMALATNGTYACLTNHSGVGGHHEEPTTDSYKVELLNDLLQRLIGQSVFAPACNDNEQPAPPSQLPIANEPGNPAGLKSYPNPTSGALNIELLGEMEAVYLTDFTGKILERLPVEKHTQRIDLSGYPSAVYFIAYFTKDKKSGTEKVVLARG